METAMMKAAFAAAGLPAVPWQLVQAHTYRLRPDQVIDQLEAHLRYPMFVKPANMGSSVGISKVKSRAELHAGLQLACTYDRRIVVEQGVTAAKSRLACSGNETPDASLPGEIIPANEWYDYEAKYLNDATQVVIPAPLTAAQSLTVRQLALRAFQAIDGAGLARVDFLYDGVADILFE
jgi:D-alanine-D-alanine ligase